MIAFDLACHRGHVFEGWFGSSRDFDSQQTRGLISCPVCNSAQIVKAPMAPSVGRKGNQRGSGERARADSVEPRQEAHKTGAQVANGPLPPEVGQALHRLADAQAKALKDSKWVGKDFAEQSRAMHYGERDHQAIHGQASLADAQALLDEGVKIAPLPLPVAPPDELN